MIKKCICIFMLLCLFAVVHAQNPELDSLLKQLSLAKEDTNKVNLLRNIGAIVSNEEPAKAIEYWKQGVVLSRKLNYTVGLARSFINIGAGYAYLSKFDSTIVYDDSGIVYSKKINNPDRLALVYLNKGDAYHNLGDLTSALLYCDTASMYAAQTNNTDRQARIYHIISSIYLDHEQLATSIIFLDKALNLYKKDNNVVMQGQVYDDFGFIYHKTGKLDSALNAHKMALRIADSTKDYKNLSTYCYSIASIYADQKKYKETEAYAFRSLKYAQQQENNIQLATAHSLLGEIYLKQKKLDAALQSAKDAYRFSLNEVQKTMQQESAALLAKVYTALEDHKNAYYYLNISATLKDSITKQAFNQQVAGLQSSFELKEKDKAILLLNKEKELQQQKLHQQNLLTIGATGLLILVLIGVWLLLNRNKLKQRMKELELRGKIAADLHDDIGSTLSSIRMYSDIVKNQPNQTETASVLMGKISSNSKEMIENMSDIVWMINPGNDEFKNIENRMLNFANEVCGPAGINFEFTKDTATDALQISMEQRRDIYLIFKEAVNNAVKYSGCHSINAAITLQNQQLQMRISDDGNGFDTAAATNGNGLSNMQKRAAIHNGKFNIQSAANEGTEIVVAFTM